MKHDDQYMLRPEVPLSPGCTMKLVKVGVPVHKCS
jgi:hypothetical protein